MNRTDAIVLINKGPDVTSFSCLNYVKRYVNDKTGHCGTLDKFATGLMIALCGKYTKLNSLFMGLDKKYVASIYFGKETDTLDPEGEIIDEKPVPDFKTIEEAVRKLKGKILQVPPVYSALHVNGKRSYQLVRSGKEVELQGRNVEIYDYKILGYDAPVLNIELHVSKGTYIRSYARDLGKLCSSCAYLTQLRRTQIGPFKLEFAIDYDDTEKLSAVKADSALKLLEELNSYTRL